MFRNALTGVTPGLWRNKRATQTRIYVMERASLGVSQHRRCCAVPCAPLTHLLHSSSPLRPDTAMTTTHVVVAAMPTPSPTAGKVARPSPTIQPFSQNSHTPTVTQEFQIGLYDPTEADLEHF